MYEGEEMKTLPVNKISSKKLTLQYAFVQGGYWASFCATYGFATVFLLSRGFNASQIGVAIAIANVMAVFLQPTVATVADSSKKISLHALTIILIIAALILFGLLFFTSNFFIATAALFVLTNAVSQTVQPLINAVSFYYINRGAYINFGLPRSMGSMAYAIVSTIIGYLVEGYGSNVIIGAGVIIFAIIAVALYSMPKVLDDANCEVMSTNNKIVSSESTIKAGNENKESILSFFKRYKMFSVALVGSTCIFIFHFCTNNYMLQIAENVGGNAATMGTALSIAAACEIPTMMFSSKIMEKIRYNYLLILSGFFFCVKAVIYLLAANVGMLYVSQCFQMISYAFYIPASVFFVNATMSESDKVKGQAIMTGTTTLGGVIGSLIGGVIIDNSGVRTLLWVGFVFAICGAVLFFISARKSPDKKAII